jgi:uncharacterized protein (DUF1919 family)
MKQSTRFRKQSVGKSKELKQIYKEKIVDKKLNIKDTPQNRIKLQGIILKEFRKMDKKDTSPKMPKDSVSKATMEAKVEKKVIKKAIPIPPKDQAPVPDKLKHPKAINPVKKNLTAYGKQTDANEPDNVSEEALKRGWTIVSDNCYGVAYNKAYSKKNNLPYITPFLGVYFQSPDWITFLENFDEYIKITPRIQPKVDKGDKYHGFSRFKKGKKKYRNFVILVLDGSKGPVEIYFAHEQKTPEIALEKWTSRTKRMNLNKNDMLVKMDDRDRFSVPLGKRFLELKQFPHKLLFVHKRYMKQFEGYKNVVFMDSVGSKRDGLQLEHLYPVPAKV